MTRPASLVVCVCLLTTATLSAQTKRPFTLGLGAGLTLLTGEDRDFFNDGLNLQGSVGVPFSKAGIDLRFDLGYHSVSGKDRFTAPPPSDSLQLGDFKIIGLNASAQYYLSPVPTAPVRAYVIAGIGMYRTEAKAVKYGQPVEGSSTNFGAAGGLGLTLRLGGMRPFVEGRIHNIFGDGGWASVYPITVGLLF